MKIEFVGDTDIGQVRKINEDAYLMIPAASVLVVCDGMGGHAAGEIASREALNVISAYFAVDPEQYAERLKFSSEEELPPGARHLVRATRLANRRIFNVAQESSATRGMGTTLVALEFDEGLVSICHVGDSRAYRFRNGKLERLTTDHSLVAELVAKQEITEEESRHFAERNVITRALGTRPSVQVDICVEPAANADIYLACSDGLCGFVEDEHIERIFGEAGCNLRAAADSLIQAANDAGGEDNITVALARVDDSGIAQDLQPIAVRTVGESEGAPEIVADAVLEELAALKPTDEDTDEDHEDDDTEKVPIAKPSPPPEKKSGDLRGRRWPFWLVLMLSVTLFVFFGGLNLFHASSEQNTAFLSAPPANEPVSPASLFFDAHDEELLGATVYVDGEVVGRAADFQQFGLDVDPGPRSVRCIWGSTTILDTVVEVHEGNYRLTLASFSP